MNSQPSTSIAWGTSDTELLPPLVMLWLRGVLNRYDGHLHPSHKGVACGV
ncbi:MAG: hypothetical protein U0575_10890 [Phycisphaerales bacterium]